MNKLYVFAIGGTGSRVLRSLTMLLASGIDTNYEIVPMIIDPDHSNGDLVRTVSIMRLYKNLHSELDFNNDLKNEFFKNPLTALNGDDVFILPLIGTAGISFESYLNLGGMSMENQAMMRMLFSNLNLSSDMNVGFKGNPNIGSVVLNQCTQSQEFKSFETDFVSGDRVFIISSIFGGTGASGFPLLLKTMRASKNTALKNAYIGAVSLLPYFNLQTNDKSAIEADSFITKTKAALNYYEKNVTGNASLDHMYYLGDDFAGKGYNNCDGGSEQKNGAHFLEMLAALSIIDFSKKQPSNSNVRQTKFHEYALESNHPKQSVVFGDLGQSTNDVILKPLSMMTLLNMYLNHRNEDHRNAQKWAKDYGELLGKKFWKSEPFKNYNAFKKYFEEWLKEMSDNNISFAPFKIEEKITDILDIVIGRKAEYKWMSKKGCDLVDKKMGDNINKLPKNLDSLQAFVELFYVTLSNMCEKNLKI